MKKKFIYLALVVVAFLFNFSAKAALFPFTATYSGSQEFPANASPGTGTITGIYDDATNTIFYKINFSGLLSGTVAGHLHAPAPLGANAPVIYGYTGFPSGVTSGMFVGSNVFNDLQETQLKSGLVYSNIHTTGLPGGEIRAQITLGAPSTTIYTFNNAYSGTQEVPPNNSPATGTITGTYDPASNVIFYRIIFNNLQSGTQAGHLHAPATIGMNASVIYPYVGFPTNVTSGMFTGTNVFTEVQEEYILSNRVYSNIHTISIPSGEIRAQLILQLAPTISCPSNIITGTDAGLCSASEVFAATTTGVPAPAITYTINDVPITSPYVFPVGTSAVTATATNATGTASCIFNVTVSDTQAPAITGISATPSVLWPPNNKMRDVRVNYTSTDNCGVTNCTLSVTSNEGTSADWTIVDAHNVKLRAKRAGNGDGRIYNITATCRDAAGNATSSSTIVTVPHDMGNKSEVNNDNADAQTLDVNVLSNPTTTSFKVNIASPDTKSPMQVRLYNLSGVLVETKLNVRNNEAVILGNTIRPGVYMLEVRQGQMMEKLKLVKQ